LPGPGSGAAVGCVVEASEEPAAAGDSAVVVLVRGSGGGDGGATHALVTINRHTAVAVPDRRAANRTAAPV
jgi:hypothetical protein